MNALNESSASPTERLLNKVPEATLLFWIIKMMSTTVGETAADFLNVSLHFGLTGTSIFTGILLAILLSIQMRAKQYVPWRYWSTVVVISVFGTLITDNLTDRLGVPLALSSAVFSLALIAAFLVWYAKEKTLSIHTIYNRRRESFYWAAILFTFALGTAVGDWIAEGFGLGFIYSGLLFGALIAATALAYFQFKANSVACFWIAYVLTRPFGASCGDWLSQPTSHGGLGLGAAGTSAVFVATIVVLVGYLTAVQRHSVVAQQQS